MRVLIIGGNRFFGSKLARNLLENGQRVTLINRGSRDDGLGGGVERVRCDRKDSVALRKAVEGRDWDIVFDQVCFEAPEARAACEIFAGRAGHYVFTSSQSVYGPGAGLPEEAFDPNRYEWSVDANSAEMYAEAKRQCEGVFFQSGRLPMTAVRFPIVMGLDDYTGRLRFHIGRVQRQEPIFFPNLDAKISFINSDDAAGVLLRLSRSGPVGPLNAASFEPISLRQVMKEIEKGTESHAVYATSGNKECRSPFGIERDWWMSCGKLAGLDFKASPILEWLPALVKAESARLGSGSK